jgi:alkylhydroperoxidase family enzyme
MTFIETVPADAATGDVAAMYDADTELRGFLPNYTQAFSQRPGVYAAWRGLVGAVTENMDPRRYELVSVAAARVLRSTYCTAAHTLVLAQKWPEPARDDVDLAVIALAEKVARDAASVEQADIDRLRALGLSDAGILDVVLAASARSFFSKALDGVGAEPDAKYASLDAPLRDALAVGRAIAQT